MQEDTRTVKYYRCSNTRWDFKAGRVYAFIKAKTYGWNVVDDIGTEIGSLYIPWRGMFEEEVFMFTEYIKLL